MRKTKVNNSNIFIDEATALYAMVNREGSEYVVCQRCYYHKKVGDNPTTDDCFKALPDICPGCCFRVSKALVLDITPDWRIDA